MIAGLLDGLVCCSSLVAQLWVAVLELLASVESLSLLVEVLFHHVDVVLVCPEVDAGVFDNGNAVLVETLGNFLALQLVSGLVAAVKVGLEVDDGDVFKMNLVGA